VTGKRLVVAGLITSALSLLLCPILGSLVGGGLVFAGQKTTPTERRPALGRLPLIAYLLGALGLFGWIAAFSISAATAPKEQNLATKTTTTTSENSATRATSAPPSATTLPVPVGDAPLLAALRIAPENDPGGYNRDAFGYPDAGTDSRGCNTRERVLQRDSVVPAQVTYPGCKITAGRWVDATTGTAYENPADVSIDHLVPLKEAYRSGASTWSTATFAAFGNDVDRLDALKVIGGSGNASKGDKDPAGWKPPLQTDWPDYARSWLIVKIAYGLTADQAEADALRSMLATKAPPDAPTVLPAQPAPVASTPPAPMSPPAQKPTVRTTSRPPGTTTAPQPTNPAPGCTPGYSPCIPPASDVDCAGGTGDGPAYVTGPVQVTGSDPYRLDTDHDGIGCEP